ncbi:MAG: 16S rRNA (cytosine(1402)-N(4))-methyltransferase RsmH [Acidobacteriaceae bacterium]|nr:16S rRNA (cytosine(1402)-N(4))-methyltransferase RsmH [Acidobacteriaceae bacterium]
MHVPVMLDESLEYLAIRPEGVYIDATCGLAGHTRAIAERLTTGRVYACDRDAESLELARQNMVDVGDWVRFVNTSFSRLTESLRQAGLQKASGLLADLGISRYQLTAAERGFSIQNEGALDMRMDRSQGPSAYDLVNFTSEKELADLIYRLGEERRSRRISRALVRARPIHTTTQLARVIEEAVPRTGRLHPATLTFMAIRMAVNGEQEELDSLLEQAPDLVGPGGRIVVISFMSLEDRKVKESFRSLAQSGRAVLLTRHVVTPTEREVEANMPSRSAKLRAVEISA